MKPALWPSLMPTVDHGRNDLCTAAAKGVRIRFVDNRELLCATSGLWNANLGYGNDAIADAVARAVRDASYLNVFRYENVWARRAADRLVAAAGAHRYSRVMFSTSGGAANDLCMKIARLRSLLAGEPERRSVIGLRNSYHGLTYGSFGLTGEDLGQQSYAVDQRYVRHVKANDERGLRRLMRVDGDAIAALVVEPVLGSGTTVLTDEYLGTIFELRQNYGFLLVADEVATGFGRVGPMFASDAWAESPDLMIVSKGLTNGVCASSAVLLGRAVADELQELDAFVMHAETQAGTPIACAAIEATLDQFDHLGALERGVARAEQLDAGLVALQSDLPVETLLTGKGMFRTMQLLPAGRLLEQHLVPALVASIRNAGTVVHNGLGGAQLVPALTYRPNEIDELLDSLKQGLRSFCSEHLS